MSLRRVVVTGIGAITPLGSTAPAYWEGLAQGVSGAGPITRFDASKFKTRFACEVKNYTPDDYFDRKEGRKMDLFTQFGVIASDEAIKDAGLHESGVNKDRVGVIWGSGIGGLTTFQQESFNFAKGDGTPRYNPFFIPKMIADSSSGNISIKNGFRGPNFVTTSACASSSDSIVSAYNYIRLGMADVVVTGGSEAAITEAGVGGFNALKAMSERNDDPATASRPYDKDRDGFVLGEGGGALVVEDYEHAKARGAKIYAEIIGGGLSSDAYHITAPDPTGEGVVLVMQNALRDAGITPEDVDYINTHGTSTPLGDGAEIKAIQKVFGEAAYNLNISSTKSMTGHLLGGAGGIEAVASILAIQHGIIPPTINHFTDDPELDARLNFTFNEAQKREVNIAVSNTFGFGGHNTSVVFRKFRD
ncbi:MULTISPECIES: beta-ketoacyl-ACP synthase II [Hymenobacter]|uniref:3-oxoacyl-[acyl-carrier-protein] synthase 2 n=2 Tax=Hymenobacter TaxID=89966 RepID=A0ABS6X0I5_9BACT|nr:MULTISPECIES: beta-ketoacyl-ACP synthase II [Hymenobacter]MBO3271619.1 beta-ketoacyl-ACP synthase II [Hymenobacter defluvii]MBW3129345.1 beta-ketoacyl-ACP synthase II [Hymenobacter profundi]QNE38367.1 beta-ketoacyl-ACP synthase II [Hymenobacter sp. NBH84]